MDIKKDIMWRINGSYIILCMIGLAVLVQIFRVQFVQGDYWRQRADSLTLSYKTIEANRGNIFSSDGSLLATSIPIYNIRMDTKADGLSKDLFYGSVDSLSLCLANLFRDRSKSEYKQSLIKARERGERYFLIRRNVHYQELQELKKFPLFRLGRFKGGLLIEQRDMREMPFRILAARTIGYMRNVKPVGIEAAFNDDLKGVSGKQLMQRISGNAWMPVDDKAEIEPKDGNDLVTTIDINIQDVAEHSLEQHLRAHNADHGCAVLMEVQTGEVRAIANLSRTASGEYVENFNYAIAEATEPGSTMKMASMLALFEDGLAEPEDTVFVGNGYHNYYGQAMKDAHAPRAPRLSVQQVFETSSNVGVSSLITQNYSRTPQAFMDRLRQFGLHEQLGIEIEGEGKPRIKNVSDKDWSAVSLPWISIGYESKLTPLQILTFYNAIANNGRKVRPRFVKEIRNHGVPVKTFDPVVLKDSIASPEALRKSRMLLEGVVLHGSASILNKSPYRIAGKTGTAQIARNKYGYDKSNVSYQASFVGYFPAEAPKYSCIVVVYAPSNSFYYGGAVAAPIFKEIADKVYANHLEFHQSPLQEDTSAVIVPYVKAGKKEDLLQLTRELNIPVDNSTENANYVAASRKDEKLVLKERKVLPGLVPDATGMSAKDALYVLENAGLRVKVKGRGAVVRQSVAAGTRITPGQSITIDMDL